MFIKKETKLEIVHKHLDEGITLCELSEEYHMHPSNIQYYVNLYKKHGAKIFTNEDGLKTYTREYKLKAIKRCLEGNESIRGVAVDLGLTDYSVLRDWIKKVPEWWRRCDTDEFQQEELSSARRAAE